jgi:hypothetical protein
MPLQPANATCPSASADHQLFVDQRATSRLHGLVRLFFRFGQPLGSTRHFGKQKLCLATTQVSTSRLFIRKRRTFIIFNLTNNNTNKNNKSETLEWMQRTVMEPYNCMTVVEQMDESLVVPNKLLLSLQLRDMVLVLFSKQSGSYYLGGPDPDHCAMLIKPFTNYPASKWTSSTLHMTLKVLVPTTTTTLTWRTIGSMRRPINPWIERLTPWDET